MKKQVLLLLFLSFSIMLFSSCASKFHLAKDNIAEVRTVLYEASNDRVSVTYMCGYREEEYIINGYATPLIEFGVLTFDFEDIRLDNDPMFALIIGTTRYDGSLEQNPFNNTFVVDIKKIAVANNIIATFISGNIQEELVLKKVNKDWDVDHEKALEIACNKLSSALHDFEKDGIFLGECYIKIVNDTEIGDQEYYWYVNIVGRTGKSCSVIINPYTGDILAQRVL